MSLSPHCPRRQRPVFTRGLGISNAAVHLHFGRDRGAQVASLPEAVQKPVTLGERVRAARHALGMSQAQLAGDELTKGFISQVEAGLVRPSLRSLQIIASRLGRSLDYFIGDESLAGAKRRLFHRLAAQAALERRDWGAVRHETTSALAQQPPAAERATLLRFLATADTAEGKREQAFERLGEAMALVDANSDPTELAQLLHARGVLYVEHGQLAAGAESLEAARDLMEQREITDPRLRARTLVHLGTVYRRLHRTAKALATYELALAVASRSSELRLAAQSHMGVAVALPAPPTAPTAGPSTSPLPSRPTPIPRRSPPSTRKGSARAEISSRRSRISSSPAPPPHRGRHPDQPGAVASGGAPRCPRLR